MALKRDNNCLSTMIGHLVNIRLTGQLLLVYRDYRRDLVDKILDYRIKKNSHKNELCATLRRMF